MKFSPTNDSLSPSYRGLTAAEALARLNKYGPNERPRARRTSRLERLARIFTEPMMLLLFATVAVYFFAGSRLETIILAISIIPIAIIEFFQEARTDEAIAALDKLLVQTCQVRRNGKFIASEIKTIVPGDLVYLNAGDRIPADSILINSPGLMVDEAVLTGESVPAIKNQWSESATESAQLKQGTLVTQGEGSALVIATGAETAYGQLGNLLERIVTEPTPLQKKIAVLVKKLALAAFLVSGLVGLLLLASQGPLRAVLGMLTVAISIIPEEFPIVFSVFLIMGVWRMTKRQALVREMAMVETLGSATVICSDKTGTLTEGAMSLRQIYFEGRLFAADAIEEREPAFKKLIHDAMLALEQVAIDPIEVELQRFGSALGYAPEHHFSSHQLRKDSSFNAATKMVSHSWQGPSGVCFQYTAGAPESVLARCALNSQDRQGAEQACESLARSGYRVIAIAKTKCASVDSFINEGLGFRGLLAMSDPPRPGVAEAIKLCRQAGVRTIMITGDNQLTAKMVAGEIGIPVGGGVITGDELDAMPAEKLSAALAVCNVYARVKPEQKYLIVKALQSSGEVVAMTGDGVNDAPALKQADIGIAMGKKGTAVARAAAGIVLLDDNFITITNAIKEGRRIYDNLRHAFVFLFSFHVPVVGLAIIPLLFGQELYFLPIHVIFLELFGDPAAVLGFERDALRHGAMSEPPRPANEPLLNRRMRWQIIAQGFSILAVALFFYAYFGLAPGTLSLGRTMSFTALIISQLALIIFSREWHQVKGNLVLLGIVAGTFIFLQLAIFVPVLRELFHFVILPPRHFALVAGTSVISMLAVSWLVKKLKR